MNVHRLAPFFKGFDCCSDWTGFFGRSRRVEGTDHLSGLVVEDIPAAVVLLDAVSDRSDPALSGNAPAGIVTTAFGIPPTGIAAFRATEFPDDLVRTHWAILSRFLPTVMLLTGLSIFPRPVLVRDW